MLLEEKDQMLKKQEREFQNMLAEREREIMFLRQNIKEMEQLLEKQSQVQTELSAEDTLLMEHIDRKLLTESIELLCRVRKIPWEPMKETEDGVWQVGYPLYPDGLFDIFQMMETDRQYRRNMDKIRKQKLRFSEMSLSQIQTYLTYLCRGERFSEGVVAEAVEDGRLLKLLLRIQELVNPYSW